MAFVRSLGGTIGVSVLGAVLSSHVGDLIRIRLSYGDATGRVFQISAVVALVAVLAVLFIREVALRTETGDEREQAERAAAVRIDTDAIEDRDAEGERTGEPVPAGSGAAGR